MEKITKYVTLRNLPFVKKNTIGFDYGFKKTLFPFDIPDFIAGDNDSGYFYDENELKTLIEKKWIKKVEIPESEFDELYYKIYIGKNFNISWHANVKKYLLNYITYTDLKRIILASTISDFIRETRLSDYELEELTEMYNNKKLQCVRICLER